MTRPGDKIPAFDALNRLGELSELSELAATAPPTGEGQGVVELSIMELIPDPVQARRVLPDALRRRHLLGEMSPAVALEIWEQMAAIDPLEREVFESRVLRLARSLEAQEQINPITVSPVVVDGKERYLIETGERRWWAHWWLAAVEKVERFETIRAVVVDQASPWRQAAENLQGEPLAAVQEACQVALLVLFQAGQRPDYELYLGTDLPLVSLDKEAVGYDFCRRAIRGRIPSGVWPLIEQATGKGARYCQYLLNLLRLSDEVLEVADRADLTESQLRPLAAADASSERQAEIVRMIVEYNMGRDEVAALVRIPDLAAAEQKLAERRAKVRKPPTIRPPERIVLERLQSMTRLLDRASRSEPAMAQVLAQELGRSEGLEERRAELAALRAFLGRLLELLPPEEESSPD